MLPRSFGKQRTVQIKSDLYSTKNVCCHETVWNSLRVLIKFRGIARIIHNIDQLSLGSVQKMMFVSVFMHVFLRKACTYARVFAYTHYFVLNPDYRNGQILTSSFSINQ